METRTSSGEMVTLTISGMHCASCVARVEKSLLRVAGVAEAAVNLATETARVRYDPAQVRPEELIGAVQAAGYAAAAAGPEAKPAAAEERQEGGELRLLALAASLT